jgi:hypothetical protein
MPVVHFVSKQSFYKRGVHSLSNRKKKAPRLSELCDPAGTRTQDPYIKSVLLYQLSYGIDRKQVNHLLGSAKVRIIKDSPNIYVSK